MSENQVSISTMFALVEGFRALRANFRPALQIAVFTMFLPQLAGEFYFGRSARQVVENLWKLSEVTLPSQGYLPFAEILTTFFSSYILSSFFIWTLFLTGYFALVALFVDYHRTHLTQSPKCAMKTSFRHLIPKAVVAAILVLILAALGQTVLPLFIFAAALALMAPILIIVENRGGFSSVMQSISMGYALNGNGVSRWNIFFALTGVVAILYLGFFLLLYLGQQIASADLIFKFSRTLWSERMPGYDFSLPFIVSKSLVLIGSNALICLLPPVTVHLYFQVKHKVSLLV